MEAPHAQVFGTCRDPDECLNEHLFANLNEARQIIEEWRIDYNTNRPHSSLNGLTPTEFATCPNRGQTQRQSLLINGGKLGSRSAVIDVLSPVNPGFETQSPIEMNQDISDGGNL